MDSVSNTGPMPNSSKQTVFLTLLVGALSLAAAWTFSLPVWVYVVGRWLLVAGSIGYGLQRRSLTTWILVSMVAGVVASFPKLPSSFNSYPRSS